MQESSPGAGGSTLEADEGALDLVSRATQVRLRVLPVRVEDGRLVLAMVDPLDVHAMDQARIQCGMPIEPLAVSVGLLEKTFTQLYGIPPAEYFGDVLREFCEGAELGAPLDDDMPAIDVEPITSPGRPLCGCGTAADLAPSLERLRHHAMRERVMFEPLRLVAASPIDDALITRVVNLLLSYLITTEMDCIVIAPGRNSLRVFAAVPGQKFVLVAGAPLAAHYPIIWRLKRMAGLDVMRGGQQQTGDIHLTHDLFPYVLRLTATRTQMGEQLRLRIDHDVARPPVYDMMMDEGPLADAVNNLLAALGHSERLTLVCDEQEVLTVEGVAQPLALAGGADAEFLMRGRLLYLMGLPLWKQSGVQEGFIATDHGRVGVRLEPARVILRRA
jgi:type II secretory ATPase GspE/PulE/Tfp pilus assembly ATPase PilB-like protein